ncbi:hypothetical protein VNO77_18199 [Canavalia gladiata]|uniref:mannan endo-1,4-beta-mannosidase n=1 Tax=Canavalia gladiata TaxID=3824 RepID=A0AAN9LL32_CANGL
MGWNQFLKNLVMMIALMVPLVVIQHAKCEEGDNINFHVSSRISVHPGGFVQRSGTNFILNNKHFYFNGFDAYWLMYMASDPSTRSKVTDILQQASTHGLTVARTVAFNDGGNSRALQPSPGSYDENAFKGLDFVISEARKYRVRLILSFVNNWKDFGGKNQYVQWAKQHGQKVNSEDDFYSNPLVKQYYKNHVKAVMTRKNTITGVVYKDDPTIFAWELMNEPRSIENNNAQKIFQSWVTEMAAYVKSIDSIHMLEIGLEGFYGETTPEKKHFNPGSLFFGTDFISNNRLPQIDYATMNLYADRWLPSSTEADQAAFVDKWVEVHFEDAKNVIGKPIVFNEFGLNSRTPGYSVQKRDSYIRKLYNAIYNTSRNGGAAAGGLIWQLFAEGMDGFRDEFLKIWFEKRQYFEPKILIVIGDENYQPKALKYALAKEVIEYEKFLKNGKAATICFGNCFEKWKLDWECKFDRLLLIGTLMGALKHGMWIRKELSVTSTHLKLFQVQSDV